MGSKGNMKPKPDKGPIEGLSGMTWTSMKKHPAILPMYALMFAGALLAGSYVFRLATKHPEVTWSRKRNPEPWNAYENKQYKFLSTKEFPKDTEPPKF